MGALEKMALRGYGYGFGYPYAGAHPGFAGSVRLSDELKAEEDFLGARRQLYGDLRTAEAAEATAAEKKAAEAREAEAQLSQSAATEQNTAATLSRLEADASYRFGPVYGGRFF